MTTLRPMPPKPELPAHLARCHSGRDGDCVWSECPQLRDNEPEKTGRHCPHDLAVMRFFESIGEDYGR